MMGRPTLYGEAVAEKVCAAVRAGNTRKASAHHAGICESTLYLWMKENAEFSDAVRKAEADAEVSHCTTLAMAAQGKIVIKEKITTHKDGSVTVEKEYLPADWRASESWLKRRRREAWGDSIDLKKLDDETLLRMIMQSQDSGHSPHEE